MRSPSTSTRLLHSRAPLVLPLVLAFAVGGCWSSEPGSPTRGEGRERIRIETPTTTHAVELVREDRTTTGTVDADVDRVWPALQQVYLDLGIEPDKLTVLDPTGHQIGIQRKRVRRLAGKRLSTFLNCGQSLGAQVADKGNTVVTLVSWLEPHGDRTAVHTLLEATAKSAGTSTSAEPCGTTGRLEALIMEQLARRLADQTQ